MRVPSALLLIVLAFIGLTACEDAAPSQPFAEVIDLGLERYLGTIPVSSRVELSDGITQLEFDVADGPVCLRGDSFRAATRTGSSEGNELMIFLQGGGACWSTVCQSFATAMSGVPDAGILSTTLEANPLRSWNVGFVPYCDGSLFAGDVELDDDGNGEIDRYHRGQSNLSAALDAIYEQFPEPSRILLVGVSAGAYGTVFSAMLARSVWADVPITAIADGGVGLGRPDEPGFITDILAEWGVLQMIPASCDGCFNDGHATAMASWILNQDQLMDYMVLSSKEDFVISSMFLGLDAQTYSWEVTGETFDLERSHPTQFARYLYDGTRHTVLAIDSSTELSAPGASPFEGIGGQSLEDILGRFDVIEVHGETPASWIESYLAVESSFASVVQ